MLVRRRKDDTLPRCGRGGIGRRAALRSLWGNPWKFESSRPHQLNQQLVGLKIKMAALPPFLLPEFQSLFSPRNDDCALPKGGVSGVIFSVLLVGALGWNQPHALPARKLVGRVDPASTLHFYL
jgi:hypothetical protein